jgi:hypothetical protein
MDYDNSCPECFSEDGNCEGWCTMGAAAYAYQTAKSKMQPHPFIKLIAAWCQALGLKKYS